MTQSHDSSSPEDEGYDSLDDLNLDDLDEAALYEDDMAPDDAPPPKPPRKKGGLFSTPVLVILGILLFVAIAYLKLSIPTTPVPAPAPEAQPPVAVVPAAPPVLQASGPLTPMPDYGSAQPPTAAPPPETAPTSAAVPAPVPDENLALGVIPMKAPPADPVEVPAPSAVPAPLAPEDVGAAASIVPTMPNPVDPVASAPVSMPQAAPAPVAGSPLPAPVAAASAASPAPVDLVPLETQIKDLTTGLQSIRADLEAQKAVPAPVPVADQTAALNGISAQVQALSARLDQLEQTRAASPVVPAPLAPAPALSNAVPEPGVGGDLSSSSPVPKKVVRAAKPQKAASVYVLRAANPSLAYVARRTGGGGLITLRVGDSLDGIGTVQAIEQVGGHWIVRGTTGTIRQ